jgi:hypothetical protein
MEKEVIKLVTISLCDSCTKSEICALTPEQQELIPVRTCSSHVAIPEIDDDTVKL